MIRGHRDLGIIIVDPAAATVAQAKALVETKAAVPAAPPTYRKALAVYGTKRLPVADAESLKGLTKEMARTIAE